MNAPIAEASPPSLPSTLDPSGSADGDADSINISKLLTVELSRLLKLRVSASGAIDKVWPDNTKNELPHLKENQTREIKSILLDPVSITFDEEEELIRARSSILPSGFYRTYYETSQTACCFVNKDTHPKHREFPDLSISEENAFQSIGSFSLRQDLTRERIERHLIWHKKINPSSYISVFNDIEFAIRRAGFHYKDSQRIGMRISIARIETNGLIPATVRAQMATTVTVTTKMPTRLIPDDVHEATKIHNITIPVWIRDKAVPKDRSAITPEQLESSGADMWLSITEIRSSDLKLILPKIRYCDTIAAKGHDYEWLACGFIPKSTITHVMPWDGVRLHKIKDARIVHSIDSPDPWVFDANSRMWRYDPRLYRTACFLSTYGGNKRKLSIEEQSHCIEASTPKRRNLVRITKRNGKKASADVTPKTKLIHNPYDPDFTPATPVSAPGFVGCCSACGQKKTPFHLDEEIDGPLSYLDLAVPSTLQGRSNTDWTG